MAALRLHTRNISFVVALAAVMLASPIRGEDATAGGISMVPQDAAFMSAALRLREQYDLLVNSSAFKAVREIPAVQRAIESYEEQKMQPGSPLSTLATFMELPENQQAVEVLEDMIANDTFVYGEPSCIIFLELLSKLQQAQQAANILQMARGGGSLGGIDFDAIDALDGIEIDELQNDDDDDGAAAPRKLGVRPARFQAVEKELSSDELAGRLVLEALAENVDKIVVPDVVWGFKTSKRPAAEGQLKRIEVLIKLMAQQNPALAESLERRKVAGGEVVTFTVDGATLPWEQMVREATEGMDGEALEKVQERLRELDLVVALGVVGDYVILSIGDSADHLEKLLARGAAGGLVATKPFEPLRADTSKRITGINYISESLAKAIAPSAADIEQLAELADQIETAADLPEGFAEEARQALSKAAAGYKKRLPIPGPWMSYSFLTEQGYEGYAWNWAKNVPIEGSKRLELLEHAGGAPLGAVVFRAKNDPSQFDDIVSWIDTGWRLFSKYLLSKQGNDAQEKVEEIDEHLAPLGEKFVGILRTKILPAAADGQIGLVLDAKARTKRPQAALPEAVEPLPLLEPAIVVGLDDAKLFREGLSDIFALTDELVDAVREISPEGVPADYRIPDPEKAKLDKGSVWSWKLEKSGIDEQVRPAIAVGNDVAVFSLVPKQAGRLLAESRLETGSQLSKFEEPLAGAAALDFAGVVDAIQPWIVYLTRYGCVQQKEGRVDADADLSADVETDQAREALKATAVVCEAIKSLRAAVAEVATTPDATVTHWRNVIRDIPAK
jgi:DNA-binding NarL/FixJ family response regulator